MSGRIFLDATQLFPLAVVYCFHHSGFLITSLGVLHGKDSAFSCLAQFFPSGNWTPDGVTVITSVVGPGFVFSFVLQGMLLAKVVSISHRDDQV
ncbi:hypothetical protein SDJN03_14774, partial [Cucurbita argyrosperma subsp. sororia]